MNARMEGNGGMGADDDDDENEVHKNSRRQQEMFDCIASALQNNARALCI